MHDICLPTVLFQLTKAI